MIFNYISTMVTKSPLDFSYEYGKVNDNGPDKFRCNNVSIITNSLSSNLIKQFSNIPNLDNDLFTDFSEESSYEIVSAPDESSVLDGLNLQKMEKVEAVNTAFKNATTMLTTFGQNIMATTALARQQSQNGGTNEISTSDIISLTMNSLMLLGSGHNLAQTIKTSKEDAASYRDTVNEMITEINAKIDDNNSFMNDVKSRLNKNKQKYVKMS